MIEELQYGDIVYIKENLSKDTIFFSIIDDDCVMYYILESNLGVNGGKHTREELLSECEYLSITRNDKIDKILK